MRLGFNLTTHRLRPGVICVEVVDLDKTTDDLICTIVPMPDGSLRILSRFASDQTDLRGRGTITGYVTANGMRQILTDFALSFKE